MRGSGCSRSPASVSPLMLWNLASPTQQPKPFHENKGSSRREKTKGKIPLEMVQSCHLTPPPVSPSSGWDKSWSWCWAGASSPPVQPRSVLSHPHTHHEFMEAPESPFHSWDLVPSPHATSCLPGSFYIPASTRHPLAEGLAGTSDNVDVSVMD